MTEPTRYQLSQLRTLEAESIHIIREVAAEFDRVLAAGEEQHGPLELGDDLAHDEEALGLQRVQV